MQKPAVAVKNNSQSSHINIYVAGIDPSQLNKFLAALKDYAKQNSLEFDSGYGLYQFTNTPVLDYAALQIDVEDIFQKIVGDADRPVEKGWYHLRIDTDVDGGDTYVIEFDAPFGVISKVVVDINDELVGTAKLPGFVEDITLSKTFSTERYNRVQSLRRNVVEKIVGDSCQNNGLEKVTI